MHSRISGRAGSREQAIIIIIIIIVIIVIASRAFARRAIVPRPMPDTFTSAAACTVILVSVAARRASTVV